MPILTITVNARIERRQHGERWTQLDGRISAGILPLLSIVFTSPCRSEEGPNVHVAPITELHVGLEFQAEPIQTAINQPEAKKSEAAKPRKEQPDDGAAASGPSQSSPSTAPIADGSSIQNPRMIGVFPGYFAVQSIHVPATQTIQTFQNVTTLQTTSTQVTTQVQTILPGRTVTVEVPIPGNLLLPGTTYVTASPITVPAKITNTRRRSSPRGPRKRCS